MSKKTNFPIYRFKGDIIRKLRLSPNQKLRILFEDLEGNQFEIDDPQQIPTIEILQKRFPDAESIKITAFFNDVPIKDEEIFFNDPADESDQKEDTQNQNSQNSQFMFIQQAMRQQDILNEMKFKNFVEITQIKIDGMKSQFEEMLSQKEKIYQEKLEIERERVKLEAGIESEGLLYKAVSNILDELSPHIGDIATTLITKYANSKQPTQIYEKKFK